MEQYSIPSIYYEDVRINICHPLDDLPKQIVKEILNELNKKPKETTQKEW